MKHSIKREQSHARMSFAECENQRSLAEGESNVRATLKHMKLSFHLILTLALWLMAAQTAWADDVSITANGSTVSDATTWKDCTVNVTGSGTVTFSNRITISGTVTLNLGTGATLTASRGIAVHEGNSLTIDGTGTLNANIAYQQYNDAAIGGGNESNAGTIIINGGTINAYGKYNGAAIGGGYCSNGGNIIINGGTVNADSKTNKSKGAGIGGGIVGAAFLAFGQGRPHCLL